MKIYTKSAKHKKVYWSIRAGGADIAESWARETDPTGLEAPKVHSAKMECCIESGQTFL